MDNLLNIISGLPPWLQITIAIFILFAIIWIPFPKFLVMVVRWPMLKLWPSREGWSADCPKNSSHDDPDVAWQSGAGKRWTQMREMRVNDHYLLHIKKPRVISRIRLVTEGIRCPTKCKIYIRKDDDSNWDEIGECDDSMDFKIWPPIKLVAFKFVILEPRVKKWEDSGSPSAWSIYDVQLTEVRLFGKWWRKVIKA